MTALAECSIAVEKISAHIVGDTSVRSSRRLAGRFIHAGGWRDGGHDIGDFVLNAEKISSEPSRISHSNGLEASHEAPRSKTFHFA